MTTSLPNRVRTALFHALRAAFRLTPMPQRTRDQLRQRFLDTRGHWVPDGPKGRAPTGELPRRPYVRSDERAIGYVPYEKAELPDPLPATLVAFYLPQFHTIPENDEWWGKGFTEWRNVTRALPQFEGHYQPKLPGDLGFYDLRNVEVMHEQARLAREYGISAFCFYFYWFGGKTLLETPLRNWLNDKTIDLKFCLCWANEKWTRTWDGRGDEILIDQQHSPEDDIAFIEHVAEYMRDPRYLRVDGKPMLLLYRPGLLPDIRATVSRWRDWCRTAGIGELHLVYVQSFDQIEPDGIGFDGAVEFPPNQTSIPSIASGTRLINEEFHGQVHDWREMANHFAGRAPSGYLRHACVNPGWDNEARRPGMGRVLLHASPRGYRDWLATAITSARRVDTATSQPVFINAWNEWAEGAVLEPDARLGYAYLQQTRNALALAAGTHNAPSALKVCVVVHAWYLDVLDEILDQLASSGLQCRLVVTTAHQHAEAVRQRMSGSSLQSEVLAFENRGRDILPFLHTCEKLMGEGIDIVLKLHTKRSSHRSDGDQWRRELIGSLLDGRCFRKIIEAFTADSRLGLVGPEGHILPMDYYWGANEAAVNGLVARMGIGNVDLHRDEFVSGSMFWMRLGASRPLLDTLLEPSLFETENGQVDGTFAHAVERVFALSCKAAGFKVASTAVVAGMKPAARTPYQYASRSTR